MDPSTHTIPVISSDNQPAGSSILESPHALVFSGLHVHEYLACFFPFMYAATSKASPTLIFIPQCPNDSCEQLAVILAQIGMNAKLISYAPCPRDEG
ncbi:hypothetical protein FRX31_013395 [Thalictrum thalictroides]|uniref:Uncharacterized protein n=1 Tax=Thalictrum thalictroides TaxID=46969 RepID=A0A7J6WKN2_THATH|nr:hypothetical protein FRX31_013395 [Thalictrum thalictroides]